MITGAAQSVNEQAMGWTNPVGAWSFSLHHQVQTCSETHQPSNPMSTGGSFARSKSSQGTKLTTHHHLVLRLRMHAAIPPVPKMPSWNGASLSIMGFHGVIFT